MVSIRRGEFKDLIGLQTANLHCLPENYHLKYYYYHLLSWPALTYVAEEAGGKIVGYVLGKIDEDDRPLHGHITSLAVMRTHRKLGLATKLMEATQRAMVEVYDAKYCSLHVRETNEAAKHLYTKTLQFKQHGVEPKYYADGENGLELHHELSRAEVGLPLLPSGDITELGSEPHCAAANGRPIPGSATAAKADEASADAGEGGAGGDAVSPPPAAAEGGAAAVSATPPTAPAEATASS